MSTKDTGAAEKPATDSPSPALTGFRLRHAETVAACSFGNSTKLKFPADKWGFTSKLKTEGKLAVSKLLGTDEKYELLVLTLHGLLAHAAEKHKEAKLRNFGPKNV